MSVERNCPVNRLILIRHGQSEHHIKGLTGGWTDTPLTDQGRSQARALADRCKRLFGNEPDLCLYSSDLLRASQTAAYVADSLGIKCYLEPALREINNGAAVGLTWEEAKTIEAPITEPKHHWIPYPNAESWHMMTERVFAGMDSIALRCTSTAIIVTHGGAGEAVIFWWLRLQESCRSGISFSLDPTSISEFVINASQERAIIRLNDTAHLDSQHGEPINT